MQHQVIRYSFLVLNIPVKVSNEILTSVLDLNYRILKVQEQVFIFIKDEFINHLYKRPIDEITLRSETTSELKYAFPGILSLLCNQFFMI